MKIRNFSPSIPNLTENLREIAGRQQHYHRTHDFSNVVKESEKLILDFVGCRTGRVIFLTSSGTGAMDATVVNLIDTKNKILIINGGDFGKRWKEICESYNLNYFNFEIDFGKDIDYSLLEEKFKSFAPTFVLVQHVETSSGQLHNIEQIGKLCSSYNSKLIVDAISGFLNDEYNMDQWGVDVTIISSQKGLGLSPGLSIIVLRGDISNFKFIKRNYYFDFQKYLKELTDVGLPFTPNLIVFNQLNYQLKEIKKRGIKFEIEKRKKQAEHFRNLIKDLPLQIIAQTPSNGVTGLYTKRTDIKDFFEYMQKKGIYFSPSGGKAGKKFIVSHMGDLNIEDNIFFVEEIKKWLKKKIVFTSGTFDLFHQGHLNILKHSKALGDKLIVAVSTDELVESYKGKSIIPFEQRVEMVKACKYVDEVIPQTTLTDIEDLKKHNVDIITLGSDWKDKYLKGMEWAKNNNMEVVYLPYTEGISTTEISKKIILNSYDIAYNHGKRGVSKIF